MIKKCITRGVVVSSLQVMLLVLCAACAAVKPLQQAEHDFYRDNSEKMGVRFKGTEAKEVIKASSEWMGAPYRYGGQSKAGVDCSGFVCSVYKEAYGITLQRSSAAMARTVTRVSKKDMQCGDLLFFTIKDKRVSHVGIYMGDNKFMHASTSHGVSMANLTDTYWSKHFSGVGRVDVAGATPQNVADNDGKMLASAVAKKDTLAEAKKGKDVVQKKTSKSSSTGDVIVVFDEEF